jgi:acetyl-CoA acetyltransferase
MHGKAAVVGIGESKYYKAGASPHSALQLAAIAITNAIADAGLAPADIDGLVTFMDTTRQHAHLCSWFGFDSLNFAANPMSGGGNLCMAAINLADAAICASYARNVVVYRAINQGREGRYGRSRGAGFASGEEAYRAPFGAGVPAIWNALLSTRFMHDNAISQDALAEIALACYAHAQRNPRAVMYGRPLTREAYDNSRWISEPFHLFDCCQENDGACALVLTSGERARDLRRRPAYILAGASGMDSKGGLWAFNDPDFPRRSHRRLGRQLWARAGVTPADIKVAQFYENFTGTTLMAIADIGFSPPEGVAEFVSNGALQWPNGRLPLNTSGGNLAEAYIHGLQLANEAVRQIRGDSTCQVENAELSLAVGGPATPPGSAVLFSRNP